MKTYDVYLGEEDDPERYEEGEIYTRALHCRLDEREMKLFADNHIAKTEKGFDVALFESALQKVLDGEISVPYFGNWLRAHSEMLQYYRGTRKMREFYVLLATMMDSLQIRLSYDKDLTACREMLISAADEILSLFRHYLA